jgi:hypothetical protein
LHPLRLRPRLHPLRLRPRLHPLRLRPRLHPLRRSLMSRPALTRSLLRLRGVPVASVPDWRGQPVCVAASGPSAPEIISALHGLTRLIVINRTHELAPDADILYAADSSFWTAHKSARQFRGLKYAPDEWCKRVCPSVDIFPIVRYQGIRSNRFEFENDGFIGGGKHSGFQALNIALLTGSTDIYLAGYDYLDRHWHDPHPPELRNPTNSQIREWRMLLDDQYPEIVKRGISVVNLSDVSTLRNYPHENCGSVRARLAALSV